MNTCALSGQAAGTLAAACLQAGKAPAELDAREIEAIRRTLARDDMLLPGAAIDDPDDLAKRASVSASSVHPGHPGGATGEISLKDGGFITFPAVRGKRIQIEVCAEQATTLRARCGSAKLPNRLNIGTQTTQRQWELQHGIQMIEAEITDENRFCLLRRLGIFSKIMYMCPPVLRHLQAQALPRIPAQAQRPFANAPLPSPDAPANFQILRSTPSLPPPLPASSILLYQVYAPRPTHTVFWNTERSPFFDTVREAEAAL